MTHDPSGQAGPVQDVHGLLLAVAHEDGRNARAELLDPPEGLLAAHGRHGRIQDHRSALCKHSLRFSAG